MALFANSLQCSDMSAVRGEPDIRLYTAPCPTGHADPERSWSRAIGNYRR